MRPFVPCSTDTHLKRATITSMRCGRYYRNWRCSASGAASFFEHAAFYGGTALRVLYGLNRYSEDIDFSLLAPDPGFSLGQYGESLLREISSFGFSVEFEQREPTRQTAIGSAFLKAHTLKQLLVIEADAERFPGLHLGSALRIKLEVDTEPPRGFETESRYLLRPIPFAVRVYSPCPICSLVSYTPSYAGGGRRASRGETGTI